MVPITSVVIAPPSPGPYAVGLAFALTSQLISVPLCIGAHCLSRSSASLVALGLISAILPLYVHPSLSALLQNRGLATPLDTLAGRFVGSSTFAFVALRMFGAALGATPKGADADLSTWLTFATASNDPLFDGEGKPLRPRRGALVTRLGHILLRLAGLSLVSSFSHPHGGHPAAAFARRRRLGMVGAIGATLVDRLCVHLVLIWLYLTWLMDMGSVLVLAQGFEPLRAFDNPLFTSVAPRDFWGNKWNLQVNG